MTHCHTLTALNGMEGLGEAEPQHRQSICMSAAERLWAHHKCLYIAIFAAVIALCVLAVVYVIRTVVTPSQRYRYLQARESYRHGTQPPLRQFYDLIYGLQTS